MLLETTDRLCYKDQQLCMLPLCFQVTPSSAVLVVSTIPPTAVEMNSPAVAGRHKTNVSLPGQLMYTRTTSPLSPCQQQKESPIAFWTRANISTWGGPPWLGRGNICSDFWFPKVPNKKSDFLIQQMIHQIEVCTKNGCKGLRLQRLLQRLVDLGFEAVITAVIICLLC